MQEKRQKSYVQLIRYALVGTTVNLLGYCVYLTLTFAGIAPVTTMTVLYAFGTLFGYLGNRKFTFEHSGSVLRSTLRYVAVYFSGWLLNYAFLYYGVDVLGYPHQIVQAAAMCVLVVYLFLGLKFVVFPQAKNTSS